jgi:selenide,water dikinase
MDESDAKEYIKEIEELSFGYASIIGHVIPRGISLLLFVN